MIERKSVRLSLRTIGVLVAIAGAIDPAVTSNRTSKPYVAVVGIDSAHDAPLVAQVSHALDDGFSVITAPFSPAAATVLVGDHLPAAAEWSTAPTFAVTPERNGPVVTIDAVRAPTVAPFNARVPVTAIARVTGARGRTLDLSLRAGDLTVDQATRVIASDDERIAVPLSYLPTSPGTAVVRVRAALRGVAGANGSADADAVVDARDRRWPVLFFDPRPSWMSTFVRRAIERDGRFVVTSRVVTSRNISIEAGTPPNRLDDIAGVTRFDAIVVGAPEALTANDVNGLIAFERRRGGAVVLLFDQRVAGAYERLTDVHSWSTDNADKPTVIAPVSGDSGALRASEMVWPAVLPAGAEALARTAIAVADSGAARPVIWRSPVGAGVLVVSGALDAWRYRDESASGFDRFWQTLLATAASGSPPPVSLALSAAIVAPGEVDSLTATVRDVALGNPVSVLVNGGTARTTAAGRVQSPPGANAPPMSVRLWTDGSIGELRGVVRAPSTPGVYRVQVTADGFSADLPIVVAGNVARPRADGRDLLGALTSARGGRLLPASRVDELAADLRRAIRPAPRAESWHPMRSGWWIVPFVLALGGDWWLRRRAALL